jgi:hypothetical protein
MMKKNRKMKEKPQNQSQKPKPLIDEPLPKDVREAFEAMQRSRAIRLNRPIFRFPVPEYVHVN